ncbi:ORC-CDC6 family AAA ATPase [Gordonia sp. HS-NH1]|uniref:ORC-CDC6 family AAA ATPase n=1 Tax=Gordonia sp. HS-NH1 TaxID=1435068 RepID=UPI000AF2DD64|nr:hypothetical protein [Gordonia sp. HS-NH1]
MRRNPFEVTKAVDFTDQEIAARFVSFSHATYPLVDPRSSITQYLVGGKGGGRTHLMRHYSYSLQKSRAKGSILARLEYEGYVGIYAPASGLDGSRFEGGRIGEEAWRAVFAQWLEVRLALLLFDVLADIQKAESPWSISALRKFAAGVSELVEGLEPMGHEDVLDGVRVSLTALQRSIDSAVNNAPLTRELNLKVAFNPGSLIFGIGTLLQSTLVGFENVRITYMLDELENLTASQQMFVNTLVREKKLPTSFLIGAREWGIRTHRTLSAGEENKEGSEFSKIVPENAYSEGGVTYRTFCIEMISKRLSETSTAVQDTPAWIEKLDSDNSFNSINDQLLEVMGANEPRYLINLRKAITSVAGNRQLAEDAVAAVRFEGFPLVEKLAILRAYQRWSQNKLLSLSHFTSAREFVEPLVVGEHVSTQLRNFLGLWRQDLIAQVYDDYSVDLPYAGIDSLISMSGFLPRSLLVILKAITTRAEWRGIDPFGGPETISVATQSAGVREASAWYLNDVRPLGQAGTNCDRAIRRFGTLLHEVRYSDKPAEVSLTTFSSNLEGVDDSTIEVIRDCVKYRMLIEVSGGRRARNRGPVHHKYQLHPMLAPFFGLGFGRRGDLTLAGHEVLTLFSPDVEESAFRKMVKEKTGPMNAPFTKPEAGYLF